MPVNAKIIITHRHWQLTTHYFCCQTCWWVRLTPSWRFHRSGSGSWGGTSCSATRAHWGAAWCTGPLCLHGISPEPETQEIFNMIKCSWLFHNHKALLVLRNLCLRYQYKTNKAYLHDNVHKLVLGAVGFLHRHL